MLAATQGKDALILFPDKGNQTQDGTIYLNCEWVVKYDFFYLLIIYVLDGRVCW